MSSPQGEQLMVKLHAMGTKGRLGVRGTCGEMEGREWELPMVSCSQHVW